MASDNDVASSLPTFKELVLGTCKNLPRLDSNIVRVFLCSTFTDMVQERNKLLREIHPKLQSYCQSKGLEFDIVDMRWGIHDNATIDHKTIDLCMLEIENCKRISQGPCFVAFLGNKYGYRPLKATIPADVFEKLSVLVEEKPNINDDLQLLRDWYHKDENYMPPQYVLQPITNRIKNFGNEEDASLRKASENEWNEVSKRLRQILMQAADLAISKKIYSKEEMHVFYSSVTEQEILQALYNNPHPEDNCLIFLRNLDGIDTTDPLSSKYIDKDADGNIDTEAQNLLRALKDDFIPKHLSPECVFKFSLPWTKDGVNPSIVKHAEYSKEIAEKFYSEMKRMIDKKWSQRSWRQKSTCNRLYEELIHHHSFMEEKCKSFKGREDIFSAVKTQLASKSDQPVVIEGLSGSGKTSIMAMIAKNSKHFVCNNVVCVLRFLGTSSSSSSIQEVLLTVCQQICYAYNLEQPQATDAEEFHKLQTFFKSLLVKAPTVDKPLLLVLDSLDQLSARNSAYTMKWLPRQTGPHTYIVLSVIPNIHDCLHNIKKIFPDPKCYISVGQLSQEVGLSILDGWLELIGRRVTEVQKNIIISAFLGCPQPLYLKIICEQVSHWPSYNSTEDASLPTNVRSALSHFFTELERRFGEVVISHALGYMSASREGLSDREMLDILSCDDEVLVSVFSYWSPPDERVVRIPSSIWKRLRFEIREFIVEHQSGGRTVVTWYHRQFVEAATERYLKGRSHSSRHKLISDMFLGVYSSGHINPVKLRGELFDKADRQVAPQSLRFGVGVFNLRKLQQLPFHLAQSNDMKRFKTEIIYNFCWLQAKLESCSCLELINDFDLMDQDATHLRDALFMSRYVLEKDVTSIAGQLMARLGDLSGEDKFLDSLLSECRRWTYHSAKPLFTPLSVFLKPPGGPLITTFGGHPRRVLKVLFSQVHQVMISACLDEDGEPLAYFWDMRTYEMIQDIHVSNLQLARDQEEIVTLQMTPDSENIVFGSQQLLVLNSSNGDVLAELDCTTTLNKRSFAVVQCCQDGKILGLRRNSTDVLLWEKLNGKLVGTLHHPDEVTHVVAIGCLKSATISISGTMRWWSLKTMTILYTISTMGNTPASVISSFKGDFIVLSGDDGCLQLWSSECGLSHPSYIFPSHNRPVTVLLAVTESEVAIGYEDGTIRVLDIYSPESVKSAKAHEKAITCLSSFNVRNKSEGLYLVAGSKDDLVSVWDLKGMTLMNLLDGHSSWISDTTAGQKEDGGTVVISASNDKQVILWNPASHLEFKRDKHKEQPDCVAISKNGQRAFSGSSDGTTKCWRCSTADCLHTFKGPSPCCLLLVEDDDLLIGGTANGVLIVWDVDRFSTLLEVKAHQKAVVLLESLPEGLKFISGSKDATLKLWQRGQCLMTFAGHSDGVTCISVVPRNEVHLAVSGSTSGEVKVWSPNGKCNKTLHHSKGVSQLAVSHDCHLVATGSRGDDIIIWSLLEVDLGSVVSKLKIHEDSIKGLAFSHDDGFLISGSHEGKQQLHQWYYKTLHGHVSSKYLNGHTHAVMCIYVTKNDKYLITGSRDCTIKAWNLATGEVMASFFCASQIKHFAVAEIHDGFYRVVAANKTGMMAIFDLCLSKNEAMEKDAIQRKVDEDNHTSVNNERSSSGESDDVSKPDSDAESTRACSSTSEETVRIFRRCELL